MRCLHLLTVAALTLASTAQADWSRDLLAAYFFNGSGEDQSGHAHDAQLVGATFTTDRHGNPEGALLLYGRGAYAITPVSGKRFPISFSFWFRLDARPGVRPFSILDSGIGEAFGHSFVIGSGPQTFNANLVAQFTFAKGRWTQVAVTYGPQLKVYMDGQLVAERPYEESDDFVAGNFQIGRHFDSDNARYFEGAIDDVLIFARPLDAQEVRQLYEEGRAIESQMRLTAEAKSQLASLGNNREHADAATGAIARPVLVVASSSAEPFTNAWHVVDGDTNTCWQGAPHEAGWWLAMEMAPPVTLSGLDILRGDGGTNSAQTFLSADADTWIEWDPAAGSGAVTARFLLLTFPALESEQAPRVSEVRWR